jgi:hypothetical protein
MNPIAIIRALRPHQWVKNGFVLAPVVFAFAEKGKELTLSSSAVQCSLLAMAAYCLGASAIYLVNDVLDVENDRQHPEKSKRPIAAGQVSLATALVAAVVCAVGAVLLALASGEFSASLLVSSCALKLVVLPLTSMSLLGCSFAPSSSRSSWRSASAGQSVISWASQRLSTARSSVIMKWATLIRWSRP